MNQNVIDVSIFIGSVLAIYLGLVTYRMSYYRRSLVDSLSFGYRPAILCLITVPVFTFLGASLEIYTPAFNPLEELFNISFDDGSKPNVNDALSQIRDKIYTASGGKFSVKEINFVSGGPFSSFDKDEYVVVVAYTVKLNGLGEGIVEDLITGGAGLDLPTTLPAVFKKVDNKWRLQWGK